MLDLAIGGFQGNGIRITGGGNDVIKNDAIGEAATPHTCCTPLPNTGASILIEGSSNNTIQQNAVTGNNGGAITITDATSPVNFTDTLNGNVSAPFTGTMVGSTLTGGLSGTYALQSGLLQGTYFSINVPTAPGTLTTTFNDLSGNSGSTTLGPWSGTLAGLGLSQSVNAVASTAPTTIASLGVTTITETFHLTGTLGGFFFSWAGTFNGTVHVSAAGNTVTGTLSGPMSVNVQETITPASEIPANNVIYWNIIGSPTGGSVQVVGNTLNDISLINARGTMISRNSMGGCDGSGIALYKASTGNHISYNGIGFVGFGGIAGDGIFIGDDSSNNVIGPSNWILGNGGSGVYVEGPGATQPGRPEPDRGRRGRRDRGCVQRPGWNHPEQRLEDHHFREPGLGESWIRDQCRRTGGKRQRDYRQHDRHQCGRHYEPR